MDEDGNALIVIRRSPAEFSQVVVVQLDNLELSILVLNSARVQVDLESKYGLVEQFRSFFVFFDLNELHIYLEALEVWQWLALYLIRLFKAEVIDDALPVGFV